MAGGEDVLIITAQCAMSTINPNGDIR
jgi:hypothetical protein